MEIVDVADLTREGGREFLEHPEAEILEHRDRFGEWNETAQAVGLETQLPRRVGRNAANADVALGIVVERAESKDVSRTFLRRCAGAIAIRESVDVGQREPRCARRAGCGNELGFNRGSPAADHLNY